MEVTFDIELHHIEKAAEKIETARKAGVNERVAVETYCAEHDISCIADVFCLAIGLVERKKTERYFKGERPLPFCSVSGNI